MDKLSISKILNITKEEVVGDFRVNNIFPVEKKKSIKTEVEQIFKINKERNETKIKLYKLKLKECIHQIQRENENRKIQTIYKINDIEYGFPEYDCDECMEFLLVELKKHFFDIVQINRTSIYICWQYTEFHKKKSNFSSNSY
jgi:hypothetical protein